MLDSYDGADYDCDETHLHTSSAGTEPRFGSLWSVLPPVWERHKAAIQFNQRKAVLLKGSSHSVPDDNDSTTWWFNVLTFEFACDIDHNDLLPFTKVSVCRDGSTGILWARGVRRRGRAQHVLQGYAGLAFRGGGLSPRPCWRPTHRPPHWNCVFHTGIASSLSGCRLCSCKHKICALPSAAHFFATWQK